MAMAILLGGPEEEIVNDLTPTSDGGAAVAAEIDPIPGDPRSWIIKLDPLGSVEWQVSYDPPWRSAWNIREAGNGDLLVAGRGAFGVGLNDFWVLRLDAAGNILWHQAYGRADNDLLYSMDITQDGGVVLAGLSMSSTPAPPPFSVR